VCGDKCADVAQLDVEDGIKEEVAGASLCCKARSGRRGWNLKNHLTLAKVY